jgi:HEPN domain-containing protein
MKRTTREWVRKAENDFQLATVIARGSKPFHDEQSFHCQQTLEKYLKAPLQELGVAFPRTHNLDTLVELLPPHAPKLAGFRRRIDALTSFAVDYRYPVAKASLREMQAALRIASLVRKEIRLMLKLSA